MATVTSRSIVVLLGASCALAALQGDRSTQRASLVSHAHTAAPIAVTARASPSAPDAAPQTAEPSCGPLLVFPSREPRSDRGPWYCTTMGASRTECYSREVCLYRYHYDRLRLRNLFSACIPHAEVWCHASTVPDRFGRNETFPYAACSVTRADCEADRLIHPVYSRRHSCRRVRGAPRDSGPERSEAQVAWQVAEDIRSANAAGPPASQSHPLDESKWRANR